MPQAMTTRKQRVEGPPLVRAGVAAAAIVDENERRLRLSFSSEAPYTRDSWWDGPWVEILGHDADEIDLSRLESGHAPVLFGHNPYERDSHVGVIEKAWIENGKGMAEVRLSKRADVDGLWADIRDGIVSSVSVGYSIHERTLVRQVDDGPSEYRVTRWTPHEVSFVPIPADNTVGVGRSADRAGQYRITDLPTASNEETTMPEVTATPAAAPVDTETVRQDAVRAERQRAEDITTTVRKLGLPAELASDYIKRGLTLEEAQREAIDKLHSQRVDAGAEVELQRGHFGENRLVASERDKLRSAMTGALMGRLGREKHDGQNEFRGMSLREMARDALERAGIRTRGMSISELVGRAFMAHGTADFTYVLENTARKMMLLGWQEAEETYEVWTRRVPMADFKTHSLVNLSGFTGLDEVRENDEYTHGKFKDEREKATLATYGKLFSITRQAIINDDLGAFTDIPNRMGRAAKRKIGDLAYAVLTSNPTMADGNALFHSSHSNYVAGGSGAAPAVSTLQTAETAMARQTDANGITLNIRPKYLIVPVSLASNARVLVSAQYDPDTTNKLQKPNPVAALNLQVVADARIDSNDAAKWFLAADQNQWDTVVIGYLDDEPNPVLEQKDGWEVDGTEFKVRVDAVAKAADWRALYHNDGN